jgi:hypothetical protein
MCRRIKIPVSRKECEGLVIMMKGVLSRLDQFEKSINLDLRSLKCGLGRMKPFTP